jgi:TctA family transporter
VLGLILVELDFPRAPLILGLVLGATIESYLQLSVARYDIEWLSRPAVIFMLLLSIAVAFSPYIQSWRRRRHASSLP